MRKRRRLCAAAGVFAWIFMIFASLYIDPSVNAQHYEIYEYNILPDGTAEITGCSGSPAKLDIPESIGGAAVSGIGDNAFAKCKNLTSVTLPDSVTSVGNDAFAECTGLVSIRLSSNLESIGYYAFFV